MADPWIEVNDRPIYSLKDRAGRYFFRPELQEDADRGQAAVFEGHHLIPWGLRTPFQRFFELLEQHKGLQPGTLLREAATNRVWLPTQDEDALRLGSAKHAAYGNPANTQGGYHPRYVLSSQDWFVRSRKKPSNANWPVMSRLIRMLSRRCMGCSSG